MTVCFVCTGNTCRSPMAEGLMKKYLTDKKIGGIDVTSAGLSALPGDEPTNFAVEAVKKYGVDIHEHCSRRIGSEMLASSLFVCMTASHLAALKQYVPVERLFLMGSEIPDPYGGTQADYDGCAQAISRSLNGVFGEIVRRNTTTAPMSHEHTADIARLEAECFELPWSQSALDDEVDNSNAFFLTALFNGAVCGYIGVLEVCGEASITNVAVFPLFQRCGIADRLLTCAENDSRRRGCDFITLEVRQSNTAAISLYEKHGFEQVGRRKGFYSMPKEDALLMTEYFKKDSNNENSGD